MNLVHDVRLRLRALIGPLIGICAIVYFAFHGVHGDRGLMTYWRLQHDIAETRAILEDIESRRLALERRVRLLRPDSLDLDMLEERARLMLNFGYPDDLVILQKENSL
ncbi:MAG: septum formation initiator family protein [Rhodospirillales bacterium]